MRKIKPHYRLIAIAILGLAGLGLAVAWSLGVLGGETPELEASPEVVVVNQVAPVLTEEKAPPKVQALNPPNLFQNVAPEASTRAPQSAPAPTPTVQTVVRYEAIPAIPAPQPTTPIAPPPPPNSPPTPPPLPPPPPPPPAPPAPKPEPLAQWVEEVQLTIVSTSLGEVGSVSISTNRGGATFSEGDEIEDGVIIKRIFPNRILLEKNGRVLEVR